MQTPPLTATTNSLVNELAAERSELSKAGHLHWFHWLIIVASAVLTILAWQFARSQVEANAKAQFDRESSQVIALVSERMQRYEDALWSGVAAIEASGGRMTLGQWRSFSSRLHIETKYPGINGIGIIERIPGDGIDDHLAYVRSYRPDYQVHPAHSEDEYLPIVYIEPEAPNKAAVGLDIAHEANRYAAADRARNSGTAQITGPIVLVQDAEHTPGFLFYAPYYKESADDSHSERRENFVGMVYAPFVVKRLMAGTLDKDLRRVGVTLSDGDAVIYNENMAADSDYDTSPMFSTSAELSLYGRLWHFDIQSTTSFRASAAGNQPIWILIGGMLIDCLLLLLFVMISRAKRRTLNFADRMNAELHRQAGALKRSNAELESFAYVASHDLKTPVRGIADLVSYIKEDLGPYLSSKDCDPEVPRNIDRIADQTERMEDLIRGILDYSGVGRREEPIETVDVLEVVNTIRSTLNVRDEQLVVEGELPILLTSRVRIEQVLANLIGNAFKFHNCKSDAIVTVSSKNLDDFVEISVVDNGPGIAEKFHTRVFEVFQSLQSKDEIEGSGVGLSIVKKSVEALGGKVHLKSAPGEGAEFRFSWPKAA